MTPTVVHTFKVGDVDDVELYITHPVWIWQTTTPIGQWVMQQTSELTWHQTMSPDFFGYHVTLTADFTDRQLCEFRLRFGVISNECI